jgi:hypothetical protein
VGESLRGRERGERGEGARRERQRERERLGLGERSQAADSDIGGFVRVMYRLGAFGPVSAATLPF